MNVFVCVFTILMDMIMSAHNFYKYETQSGPSLHNEWKQVFKNLRILRMDISALNIKEKKPFVPIWVSNIYGLIIGLADTKSDISVLAYLYH